MMSVQFRQYMYKDFSKVYHLSGKFFNYICILKRSFACDDTQVDDITVYPPHRLRWAFFVSLRNIINRRA